MMFKRFLSLDHYIDLLWQIMSLRNANEKQQKIIRKLEAAIEDRERWLGLDGYDDEEEEEVEIW
jgi:hypothetical protein